MYTYFHRLCNFGCRAVGHLFNSKEGIAYKQRILTGVVASAQSAIEGHPRVRNSQKLAGLSAPQIKPILVRMTVENHYLSKDDLTPHQKSKISELREKASKHLAKYPDYDTDFSLLRWLMGWDYDIDVILPKIRETLDVLSSLRMDEIHVANVNELNARIRSMSNVCEYFPGGLMCQDDEGNVVYMQALARTHPRSLIRAGGVSDLFRLSVVEAELAFKLVRKAEEATGRKLGAKLVIDLDEFSMDVLYPPALNVYLNLLTLLQVPERFFSHFYAFLIFQLSSVIIFKAE
ncbi:hypothetical protein Y032_0285g1369 [Ancylostoma ceylanicum]|uniref:CRAL-TRIO domain-containing protein n=1 Tax=Ancylostoma ceylanicum TaxID=53326 RepID=A0A016S663_9BILA|nr:hypothetical protein Y032_0285g1369 [Ancylostoma ceylanicum]